jgi:uncharacterized membrane protein YcgQ (UPF0703/DUF1980 family)
MRLLWRRIERGSAWLLVPLMLLQFLSGYAILHWRLFEGILSKPTAFRLHSIIQPLTVVAFVIHGFTRVRRGLAKRRIIGRWVDGALVVVGAGLISFASYLTARG